jgi:type IV secretory pathway VirJ component
MNHIGPLSPSISTDFVINLRYVISDSRNAKRKYKIDPELADSNFPIICIFGMDEDLKLKNTPVKSKWLKIHKLPGKHHYKENTALLIKLIDL